MHKILLKFPFIALIIFSLDVTSQALNEANAYLDSLPESIRADVNREMERTAYEDGKEVFFSKIPSEIEKMLLTESGTISLSGTFLAQQTTTESFPLMAIEVYPNC